MNNQNNKSKINTNFIVKIILDVLMTILFLYLMKISFVGIQLHELIGIGIFFLFIIHKILNYKWIVGICKNFFNKKISAKAKFMFILDAVLLVLVTFIVISGILISQTILTEIYVDDIATWSGLHHFAAYSALILLSIHIGMHWQMIMGGFNKMCHIRSENGLRTALARVASLIIALIGIKSMMNPDIQSNFTAPFVSDSQTANNYSIVPTANKDDEDSYTIISLSTTGLTVDVPTLEEYLSKLVCTGCSKRCPLTSLGCSRGESYKAAATTEYYQTYTPQEESSANDDSSSIEDGDNDSSSLNNDSSNSVINENQTDSTTDVPTLEEYLSKLVCTGCGKRCPLTNLKCSRGESYKTAATEEYYNTYQIQDDTSKSDVYESESDFEYESDLPNGKEPSPIDYFGIMGLFVAGTHYTITIPKKLKEKNKK